MDEAPDNDLRWRDSGMPRESHDLLRSGTRAKWITAVGQHADEWAQTLFTRDPDVIRAWALERAAEPALGTGTARAIDGGSHLRLEFPGMTQLEPLSWADWFREFEIHGLIFAFRERREDGRLSQDYRIVMPDQLDAEGQKQPPRNDPP
jgi:hypothetical protein